MGLFCVLRGRPPTVLSLGRSRGCRSAPIKSLEFLGLFCSRAVPRARSVSVGQRLPNPPLKSLMFLGSFLPKPDSTRFINSPRLSASAHPSLAWRAADRLQRNPATSVLVARQHLVRRQNSQQESHLFPLFTSARTNNRGKARSAGADGVPVCQSRWGCRVARPCRLRIMRL